MKWSVCVLITIFIMLFSTQAKNDVTMHGTSNSLPINKITVYK